MNNTGTPPKKQLTLKEIADRLEGKPLFQERLNRMNERIKVIGLPDTARTRKK